MSGGALTLTNGGNSDCVLTGTGKLNIDGGVLTNSGMSATTNISSVAEVVIGDVQSAGTGVITDDGTLTLDGVTGALVNNLSGTGDVDATNTTDVVHLGNKGYRDTQGMLGIKYSG